MSLVGDPIVLVITLVLIFAVLLFARTRVRPTEERREVVDKRLEQESETRSCPNCGGTMEEGYLSSRGGIYWTRQPMFGPMGSAWGFPGAEAVGQFSLFPTRSQRGYRCTKCRTILIEPDKTGFGLG